MSTIKYCDVCGSSNYVAVVLDHDETLTNLIAVIMCVNCGAALGHCGNFHNYEAYA